MKKLIAWEKTCFMLKERCRIQNVIKILKKNRRNQVCTKMDTVIFGW